MDKDEQELAQIQTQFTQGMASSEEQYHRKVEAALAMCLDQIQGASEEQKQRYWQQYQDSKNTALQECIERNNAMISIHAQRMKELDDRLTNTLISPFWRIRVLRVSEGIPSYLQRSFLKITIDAYSAEALREFLRFFLNTPVETEQGSPIEFEVIRVTQEESVIFLKGGEVEDRSVYHVDFRQPQQRDLIGYAHIQDEIIGAWVSIGGRFVHRVTDYDRQDRPFRLKD